ncbi:hypothetical protein [Oceaniglobus trochenteri]|uniref:hypothetical protein n=1 Tax=Oceaniglobus trochenteri TaxID=2763260 RepID=UPI001CFF96FB|nr:hypothetical protein [Oceaniglobus trochenteri]
MAEIPNAAAPAPTKPGSDGRFNIFIVVQSGRLAYEAALFAASLRHTNPDFAGRLILGEPQPGPLWKNDPRLLDRDMRDLLTGEFGAEILPFESRHFGETYPQGNKIEGLFCLPEGEPFVFFDTDTLITGPLSDVPFDFNRPTASLRREGTWPEPQLYQAGYTAIWKSLYDRFGLDFDTSLDRSQPDEYWRRYLYFNAGWFFHACPRQFGERFLRYALSVRDDPPDMLAAQTLDPWLDQVVLPLVIHSFGGGRDTLPEGMLDGTHSCHYRMLPLLYAREDDHVVDLLETVAAPNKLKKLLKGHVPILRMVYQNRGQKARAMFDRANLPRKERQIRNQLRRANLWMR